MSALAWLQAGSQLLGAVGGLGAAPPSSAVSGIAPTISSSAVDFSGFTVATGSARAEGATITKPSSDSVGGSNQATEAKGINIPGLLTLIGGGLLAAKFL